MDTLHIHRIRGRNLREALERAREEHGAHALVLSQEQTPSGEFVLAVADRRMRPARAQDVVRAAALTPGLGDIARRLDLSGASPQLVREVVTEVERGSSRGAFALDAAAESLSRRFKIAASPRAEGGTSVIAFVGPTGVGKTTTLAKLATRLVRAGRRVSLVSIDNYRTGALTQLETYADRLSIESAFARDGNELAQVIERSRRCDAVLIDTAGRSPRDGEELERMATTLKLAGSYARLHCLLVLAANASTPSLEETVRAFSIARPNGVVITKLDETRATAPAFEVAAHSGLGLSFLCDGQDVARHFHRASADRCADLFLRGKIA